MSSLNRAERALQAARRTGTVHLGGEIEFPLTATLAEAHEHLFRAACEVGGVVSQSASDTLRVLCDPYDPGYWSLDWLCRPDGPIHGLTYWTPQSARNVAE